MKKTIIAVDIGASSGRLILGWVEGNQLKLKEVHRFKNQMAMVNDHYKWDVDGLFDEIIDGLMNLGDENKKSESMKVDSIGIDTWAVDYTLIDSRGDKIGGVYAYRDHRTDETMAKVFDLIDRSEIYEKTGIQFLQFNSIYQLYEHQLASPNHFQRADQFLMVPDYLNYRLSGVQAIEYTNASSTQLLNVHRKDWDPDLLKCIGVTPSLMTKPIPPGTILGDLLDDYQRITGFEDMKVIAPATHDTGSAVVSVPARDENFAYISSGTWSLMGIETKAPITTETALRYNFTNEGGAYDTYRFLKNIMGLWLIQEVVRLYKGMYSFAELVRLANEEEAFRSLIHPNDVRFLNPDHMIKTIEDYCEESNQPVPKTPGQVARCIFESLALLYKEVLGQLEEITGKHFSKIHIIGGGCQNQLLNQLCADMTQREVLAGPIEATAIGNIAVQMITLGWVKDLSEARELIGRSFDIQSYQPREIEDMDAIYKRFRQLGGI